VRPGGRSRTTASAATAGAGIVNRAKAIELAKAWFDKQAIGGDFDGFEVWDGKRFLYRQSVAEKPEPPS
jgi:hypothetical protein